MTFEHVETQTASVSADAVWRLWADPATWPTWDPPVDAVRIDGTFEAGATGVMSINGIEMPVVITVVEPGRRYVDELRMGDLVITIDHVVTSAEDGVQVSVATTITGPGADDIGPMVTAAAPQAIASLLDLAAR